MKKMDLKELAQHTYQGLKRKGISVTLSGGACVSIYTENAYESIDLDFIRELPDSFEKITAAMSHLGFNRKARRFLHPDSDFYVEFPPPPLSVGEEPPKDAGERILHTSLGDLAVKMLSPTDCVKDRLCGFFHWNDRQSLDQAILVSLNQEVDQMEIRRWAENEGMREKCLIFSESLEKKRAAKKRPK